MNTVAAKLGLSSTHITDPSGVDPGTTASAEDLVRLGEAAMSIPVLRQVVSLGQASVPMTTVVYNLNFDLGRDGIIGVKTGSDSSAQGCYLFAAQQSIGGKEVTVVGAVLGQPGGSLGPNTTAVDAGDALVKSTFAAVHGFTAFAPGQKAGEVSAPWGAVGPAHGERSGQRGRMAGTRGNCDGRAHDRPIVPCRKGRWSERSERARGAAPPRSRCAQLLRSRVPDPGGASHGDATPDDAIRYTGR